MSGTRAGGFRQALHAALLVAVVAATSSCAASRALNQPLRKDYGVLEPGTDVDLVRAEFGEPLKSERGDCDVFVFPEGSSGWRYLRAVGYSLLDVGTLGLSEIAAYPLESSVGKRVVRLRVCYDANHEVKYSERLEVGQAPELVTGTQSPATRTIR